MALNLPNENPHYIYEGDDSSKFEAVSALVTNRAPKQIQSNIKALRDVVQKVMNSDGTIATDKVVTKSVADEAISEDKLSQDLLDKINDAFTNSNSSVSDTEPNSPTDGYRWYDTKNKVIKVYNADKDVWELFDYGPTMTITEQALLSLSLDRSRTLSKNTVIYWKDNYLSNDDKEFISNVLKVGSTTSKMIALSEGLLLQLSNINSNSDISNIVLPEAVTATRITGNRAITDQERADNDFFISTANSGSDPQAEAQHIVGDLVLHDSTMYKCIIDDTTGDHILTGDYYTEVPLVLTRTDLVQLIVFHEKVSDKDFVYPLGNIQYRGADTDNLSGISEGSFDGYTTYSLFGSYQSEGAVVGKGYVWSSLTDTEKQLFSSNPFNNLYMKGEDLYQVRYKINVIKNASSSDISESEFLIATVSRRNKGAYDDTYNTYGSAVASDTIDSTSSSFLNVTADTGALGQQIGSDTAFDDITDSIITGNEEVQVPEFTQDYVMSLLGGSDTQRFKVADAVEDDEAVNKKQLDNMTTKTESPKLSLNSISINERGISSVNIINYDSRLDYYVQSTDNNLATGIVTSDGILQITTGDITDSVNHNITIGVQAKAGGLPISDLTNIDVTVVYVPEVSDTTIQVTNISDDLEYNDGFEGVQ